MVHPSVVALAGLLGCLSLSRLAHMERRRPLRFGMRERSWMRSIGHGAKVRGGATPGPVMGVGVNRDAIDIHLAPAADARAARLVVRNVGMNHFAIDSGIPIAGWVVKPGTRQVIGTSASPSAGTGGGVRLEPGETGAIPVSFDAARCGPGRASALVPGRYGLRVVLEPQGPLGADLSPVLLAPETIVMVER
jgi:hypothetical protein